MKRWLATGLGLAALAGTQMGGCGGGGGSDFLPTFATVVVVNNPDSFSVAISGFDYDGTVDRDWSCAAAQANLTIGSSMADGSVSITVYDDADAVVYANSHHDIGGLRVQTRSGAPGLWRVVMIFSDATISGAITLDADLPPTLDAISLSSAFGTSDSYRFHAEWGAVTADISVGNVSANSLIVRIWHGGQDPDVDVPFFEQSMAAGTFTTGTGSAGTWTVDLVFSSATLAGAVTVDSN